MEAVPCVRGPQALLQVSLRQRKPIPLDVELSCRSGELLALVGPSGSGKSTVLRCVAGLHHPTVGHIRCGEQVWLDTARRIRLPPQARRVGFVFQSYALFPHLTAGENIAIALGHLPATERDARTRALLARVHLDGLQNRRPTTLSGGQQQRVALARALAREPSALLLDEPFSAVDQVTRRKLRLELAALTRDLHLPIILVTHDLNEAAMLADRLCVLHGGHALQSGTPQEVMNHPRTATIARLMDALNLFEGKVLGHWPTRGSTLLAWNDHVLEVRLHENFPPGCQVHWMIPPGGVLLHRRGRPASRGERENPLSGVITELLTNGGLSTVILQITAQERPYLTLELPPHVVRRNNLRIGERINVSLVGTTVHLMSWQPTTRHQ